MHCEGCARKVRHAIKGFEGVESVLTDCPSSKLTVVGKVDPWKVRDRVESKTHKTVALISPNVPKKEEKPKEEKKGGNEKGEKKADDKKSKEPVVSTVTLHVRFHCEGCVQRIERIIAKVNGVEAVVIDRKKEEVTVKGTMDAKALPEYLKQKLKRSVSVVGPKKDDGGGEKKKEGGGEKKKEEGGGGEKKKEEGGGAAKAVAEANKMEFHGLGGFGVYAPPQYGYNVNTFHAPQYFSDENPNACSVM
ncbi:unnamed protein product [Spirodela intermedia]|uniref:HMA domain-containing protein n=1 Tax=Spirodela intermedia TaxID=51605 RepID=A0A7I8LKI0_SPIIN|nr:unnamed protein product [Spirodela intermedia]